MDEVYLTIKQVAAELGKSYYTVLKMIHNNQLKGIRQGGQWSVAESEVQRFKREGNWQPEVKEV